MAAIKPQIDWSNLVMMMSHGDAPWDLGNDPSFNGVIRRHESFFDVYCSRRDDKAMSMRKYIDAPGLQGYMGLNTYCITLKRSIITFVVHYDGFEATIGNVNVDLTHSYESNVRKTHCNYADYDIPQVFLELLVELCRSDIRGKMDLAMNGEFVSMDKSHFALANAIDLMKDGRYHAAEEQRQMGFAARGVSKTSKRRI